jgi:hypothetical protein
LKLNASADKDKVENSLYSLVYDFKRIGPSMHVDQVKALVGFNSTIACKTKSTTQKNTSFRFLSNSILSIYFFQMKGTPKKRFIWMVESLIGSPA